MASAAPSRWADPDDDAAFEAKRRRDKEEKKRRKAEKAERARQAAAAAAAAAAERDNKGEAAAEEGDRRPSKRRKLTPEPDGRPAAAAATTTTTTTATTTTTTTTVAGEGEGALLRWSGGALPPPSRSVEHYEKLNDIEEGAYGWVARARDRATGAVVALKRLKLDAADRGGVPVTGLREIQLLRDCAHRNVVQLREVVVGERRPIDNILLVLEFVEHDLKSILEDMPQPFLASEVKTLLRQLAAGVAYLHSRWILHRDLKTSNLLLNNRGQLKIADFGMARYWDDDGAAAATSTTAAAAAAAPLTPLVVTLWYRAPELLLGAPRYGRPVDLWSVGCIFAELLTREPLLPGKNEADALARIFALCGVPSDASWPGWRRLPNASLLKLPPPGAAAAAAAGSAAAGSAPSPAGIPPALRAKFPLLTAAGCRLLASLLALDPAQRPTARAVLDHEFFHQDPRPKPEALFPTFPSKAGQERRRRRDTPNAPQRGAAAADLGAVDLAGIFGGRDREERGAGFSLRMV